MPKRAPRTLTAAHLRTLLQQIGARVSGKKQELAERLRSELSVSRLADAERSRHRIVSVDMGIRHMAFCACDATTTTMQQQQKSASAVKLDVLAWEPVSVGDGHVSKESFQPSVLSRAAYALLTRKLLAHSPHVMLIEQQRHRTHAGAAIQEWTYHVNMLEGMLWAVIETLRQEPGAGTCPAPAFSVNPARVAKFWLANPHLGRAVREAGDGLATAADEENGMQQQQKKKNRLGRSKVEKRVKIKLVEQWLLASARREPGPAEQLCDIQVAFSTPEASRTRDMFLSKLSRKKGSTAADDPKKLDDLADCLLQAAAWAQWEVNRRAMRGLDDRSLMETAERCS